jgi:hypothetical protein
MQLPLSALLVAAATATHAAGVGYFGGGKRTNSRFCTRTKIRERRRCWLQHWLVWTTSSSGIGCCHQFGENAG